MKKCFRAAIVLLFFLGFQTPAVWAGTKYVGYTRVTDSSSVFDKMKKLIKNPFSKDKTIASPYIKQTE